MSVEFEPVKLGPRRRRVDPVAIGALVVVIGVVAAVLKPWNTGFESASSGPASEFAETSPSPSTPDSLSGPPSTAAINAPRIPATSTAALAVWNNVRAAIRPHDTWGIRAIVAEPSASIAPVTDQRFAEHWDSVPDDPLGSPTVDIEPNDRTVVAIGITFPPSHTPLDARIWLVHPERLEWIDTKAVDASPSGGAWPPGVYRLTVAWADSAGLHKRSWHVELRPGPVRELPSILLAARGFARYAGSSGVVVGTAEPLEGGPRSVAIRLLQPRPTGATGFPARDQVRCDGVRVDGLAGVAGVAYPADPPSKVTARVLYEFSRSEEQPILTAAGDVPGLVLVAPVGEFAPTSSAYRLRVGDDTQTPGTTVCLWATPAG